MTSDPFEQLRVRRRAGPSRCPLRRPPARPGRRRARRAVGTAHHPAPREDHGDDRHDHPPPHGHVDDVHLRHAGGRRHRLVPRRLRCRRDDPLHRRRRPHRPRRDRHRRRPRDALRRVPRARRAGADVPRRHAGDPAPRGARRRRHVRARRRRRRPGGRARPKDEAYGARSFSMLDPFGHRWMVQTPTATPSLDELQARVEGYTITARSRRRPGPDPSSSSATSRSGCRTRPSPGASTASCSAGRRSRGNSGDEHAHVNNTELPLGFTPGAADEPPVLYFRVDDIAAYAARVRRARRRGAQRDDVRVGAERRVRRRPGPALRAVAAGTGLRVIRDRLVTRLVDRRHAGRRSPGRAP